MTKQQHLWIGSAVIFSVLTITLSSFLLHGAGNVGSQTFESLSTEEAEEKGEVGPMPLDVRFPHSIGARSTLSESLGRLGIGHQTIWQIVETARPFYNLGRLRPGTRFRLIYEQPVLSWEFDPLKWQVADASYQLIQSQVPASQNMVGIEFLFSPQERLEVKQVDGHWVAWPTEVETEIRRVSFAGVVKSSLWGSARTANMDAQLIANLSEIFSWEIDFSRQVRAEDRWRISVEQEWVDGEFVGWGSILSAEYINQDRRHSAILFRHEGETIGYFNPEGESLRRMFLRNPIEFARISSGFARNRFHPILEVNRPHLGVDYAAPTGTPIRAVGDGRVTLAANRGGGGNTVRIRHNEMYSSAYMHMSRFARGIRPGVRVQQGQVIGYVGQTGLATGPHLHYEFYVRGQYVDPLRQEFPSADPVPDELMPYFKNQAVALLELLPDWGGSSETQLVSAATVEPEIKE